MPTKKRQRFKKPRADRIMREWTFRDGKQRQSLIEGAVQQIRMECGLKDAELSEAEDLTLEIRAAYRLSRSDDRIVAIGADDFLHRVARAAINGGLYSDDQRARAARSRGRRVAEDAPGGEARYNLQGLAAELLATHGDLLGSRELWPHLVSKLDALGLEPRDNERPWSARAVCLFDDGRITRDQFQTALKNARRRKNPVS